MFWHLQAGCSRNIPGTENQCRVTDEGQSLWLCMPSVLSLNNDRKLCSPYQWNWSLHGRGDGFCVSGSNEALLKKKKNQRCSSIWPGVRHILFNSVCKTHAHPKLTRLSSSCPLSVPRWTSSFLAAIKFKLSFKSQLTCHDLLLVGVSQSVLSNTVNPMDSGPPGSSVHGILQARIVEWIALPFSSGSSLPRDRTRVSYIAGRFFTIWATREAPISPSAFLNNCYGGNGVPHSIHILKLRFPVLWMWLYQDIGSLKR